MRLNGLQAESLEYSGEVSGLDLALVLGVVHLHRFEQRLPRIRDAVCDFHEHLVFHKVRQRRTAVADIGVQLCNELVVANGAVSLGLDQPHEVVDFVVLDTDFQARKSLSQLLLRYFAVPIDVEELESLFEVEVLEVERGGYFVEGLVQPDCPEVLGFKSGTELLEFNLADALWVGDPSQNSEVLHGQGQVEFPNELLELLNLDDVFVGQRVKVLLEAVEERYLAFSEQLSNFAD